ncbi:MAG: hypothetical protein F4X79_06915 [Acidobacteria bacterium]|nr:hypothetical protein [Acidobacteriota bacterium]
MRLATGFGEEVYRVWSNIRSGPKGPNEEKVSSHDRGASSPKRWEDLHTWWEKLIWAVVAVLFFGAVFALILWFVNREWGLPGIVVFLLLFFFWAHMMVHSMMLTGEKPWERFNKRSPPRR